MSVKSFQDLIAAGEKDEELAAALNRARSLSEVVALGAARGHAFTEAEARLTLLDRRSHDLDDNDLEHVSGGRKAGSEQQEYFKITMKDVLITSYSG